MNKAPAADFKHATLNELPLVVAGYVLLDEDAEFVGIYARATTGGLFPARTVAKADAEHCARVCAAWLRRANTVDRRA